MSETYTREDAVAAIIAMDAPQQEQEVIQSDAAPVVEDDEVVTTEAADDTSEEVLPGDDVELELDETPEAEAEVVNAPNWWDAEDKELFATLTPEQAAAVAKNEAKREAVVQKTKQEAADARKASEAKVRELDQFTAKLDEVVNRADKAFRSKWDGMTPEIWSALAEEDPETAFKLKLEYDSEQEALKSVRAEQDKASHLSQQQFYAEQRTKLQELAPELVSDPEKLKSVAGYIVNSGIPPEAIAQASAEELNIVYKAMKYDQMVERAKAAKANAPKEVRPAPQKSLAPAASRESPLPPQQRELQQVKNRLAQTGSRDDLAAMFKMGAFG